MIIIISVIASLVIAAFFGKRLYVKNLQNAYESSLLKGNKEKSARLGRLYYLSLDEEIRKAKGIVDIEEKVADDFRAFNNPHFMIL